MSEHPLRLAYGSLPDDSWPILSPRVMPRHRAESRPSIQQRMATSARGGWSRPRIPSQQGRHGQLVGSAQTPRAAFDRPSARGRLRLRATAVPARAHWPTAEDENGGRRRHAPSGSHAELPRQPRQLLGRAPPGRDAQPQLACVAHSPPRSRGERSSPAAGAAQSRREEQASGRAEQASQRTAAAAARDSRETKRAVEIERQRVRERNEAHRVRDPQTHPLPRTGSHAETKNKANLLHTRNTPLPRHRSPPLERSTLIGYSCYFIKKRAYVHVLCKIVSNL